MLNVPSAVIRAIDVIQYDPLLKPIPLPGSWAMTMSVEIYFTTLKTGRISIFWKLTCMNKAVLKWSLSALWQTLHPAGLVLVGILCRKKKCSMILCWTNQFSKTNRISLWTLLGCVVFAVAFFGTFALLQKKLPCPFSSWRWFCDGCVLCRAGICCMGGWLLFAWTRNGKNNWCYFYSVGRMGSPPIWCKLCLACWFFGVGFGLLGDIGALAAMGLSLAFWSSSRFISASGGSTIFNTDFWMAVAFGYTDEKFSRWGCHNSAELPKQTEIALSFCWNCAFRLLLNKRTH